MLHGSNTLFTGNEAVLKLQRRTYSNEIGERVIGFEGTSFHATPHKWIALAYTYKGDSEEIINGNVYRYNMGVSLYENDKQVYIYGLNSLEQSLKVLYGEGVYIYHFNDSDFFYTEGLGNLEVIADKPTTPVCVERIENPVEEMKKEGVIFIFKNLVEQTE